MDGARPGAEVRSGRAFIMRVAAFSVSRMTFAEDFRPLDN
jgi:hypothetical protein